MSYLGDLFATLKKVFRRGTSWGIVFTSVFLFYALNVFIFEGRNVFTFLTNFGIIISFNLIFNSFINLIFVLPIYSLIGIFLIGALTGVLISLILYKIKEMEKDQGKIGFIGFIGIFLGIGVTGCTSCGLGFLGLLGLSSSLAVLPFKGFEITIISITLLLISIFLIIKRITYPVCKIPLKNERRNK